MTTYPLVMALQYFQSHPDTDPKAIERATEKLERVSSENSSPNCCQGYKRLAGYECTSGGFEWFGGNPGHEGSIIW